MTLHYTTLHDTYYTTPHYTSLHYTTLHYATVTLRYTATTTTLHYTALITLHYITTTTTLPYTRLCYTIPHYTTFRNTTRHYAALHYTNYTTLQLRLHYATLHYNYSYNCNYNYNHYTTLHPTVVVRWPLQPLQPFQKTQLQPPFGPSVDSLCHPWFTTTNLSYRFPIFETSATALCGTTGIIIHELQSKAAKLGSIPVISHQSSDITVRSHSIFSFIYQRVSTANCPEKKATNTCYTYWEIWVQEWRKQGFNMLHHCSHCINCRPSQRNCFR